MAEAGLHRGGSGSTALSEAAPGPKRLDLRQAQVLALLAALVAIVAILYWETFASMLRLWRSVQHGHSILVFPIVAYLLWRVRDRLAVAELKPAPAGTVLLAGIVALWFVGAAAGIQAVEQLAAVLLIPATVATFFGWPFARSALFPLLFAVAAVPVGDGLIPHLMRITATLSTALLQVAGVPVFRQGQFLSLPGGHFEIADVCAGMQYLTAGTIIGALTAYFTFRSATKRVACVLVFAGAMVIMNGVRAFLVMLIASASEMRYLVGQDHVLFGWVLFSIAIAVLIVAAGRFADDGAGPARSETGAGGAAPPLRVLAALVACLLVAGVALAALGALGRPAWLLLWPAAVAAAWLAARAFDGGKAPRKEPSDAYRRAPLVAALCAAAVLLAAGPVLRAMQLDREPVAPPAMRLPHVAGCDAPTAWVVGPQPEFQSPAASMAGTYSCDGAPVSVFAAAYVANVQGHELVSDANRLAPPEWRHVTTGEVREVALPGGRSLETNELELAFAGSRWLMWYWYVVGDELETSGTAVKLKQAIRSLRDGRADGSIYVLETPLDSLESSRARLARVMEEVAKR